MESYLKYSIKDCFRKESGISYCIFIILTLIPCSAQTGLHSLTFINRVKSLQIVSLYIWGSDQTSKGDNWMTTDLQPDSAVTFSLPSGKCNILAFDELGNSYGIAGNYQKNTPDTISIDLQYITFGRPNADCGHYLLNLTDSLHGFALDTLILSSSHPAEDIVIDDFRIFPGKSIIIWLDKGFYSIRAVDQAGGRYSLDNIRVPSETFRVSIIDSMIVNPRAPVGVVGNGTESLVIENCLPVSLITGLLIESPGGSDEIFLDSLALQPGESIIAGLDPGDYSLTAMDDHGDRYSMFFKLRSAAVTRLPLTDEYLRYDFSFPGNSGD